VRDDGARALGVLGILLEPEREHRGDGRRDDASRRHEREERLFGRLQRRAQRAYPDAEGTHHKNQHREEQERAAAQLLQVVQADTRAHENEQRGDQEHLDRLLEVDDVVDPDAPLVAEVDAHQRHREQPRLMLRGVACGECGDRECQRGRAVQVVGDPEAPQQGGEQPARDHADAAARHDGDQDALDGAPDRAVRGVGQEAFEHQHREHRADGVDQDAFPFQDRAGRSGGADLAQQRPDDGGPRHHEDRTEQDRGWPRHARDVARRERREQPRDERTQRHQPEHNAPEVEDLVPAEGEPAFEQEQRDRERDDGQQQVAEQVVRVDQAGDLRPDEEPGDQQQQDGRESQPPREPLRADARDDDDGEADDERDGHAAGSGLPDIAGDFFENVLMHEQRRPGPHGDGDRVGRAGVDIGFRAPRREKCQVGIERGVLQLGHLNAQHLAAQGADDRVHQLVRQRARRRLLLHEAVDRGRLAQSDDDREFAAAPLLAQPDLLLIRGVVDDDARQFRLDHPVHLQSVPGGIR
jgi:hypothetical protein